VTSALGPGPIFYLVDAEAGIGEPIRILIYLYPNHQVAGYKDGYKTVRMKQEERINRVYAQIAQEGRSTSNPGGYDHNRKKGTEYG
jgi:UDP-N-acetyl-D-mannosaminuronic acid transferase (WecB/TagA/CpsF family)